MLNKRKILIAITGLLILVILLSLWVISQNQEQTKTNLPTTKTDSLSKPILPLDPYADNLSLSEVEVTLSTTAPTPPQEFSLPQYDFELIPLARLAISLDLTQEVNQNLYKNNDSNKYLSQDNFSHRFIYTSSPNRHVGNYPSEPIDQTVARETASKFLADHLGLRSIEVANDSIVYLVQQGAHLEEVEDPNNASFVQIDFDLHYLDKKITYNYQSQFPFAQVLINNDYQVVKASFIPIIATTKNITTIPSFTLQESLDQNSFALIRSAVSKELELMSISNISRLNLTEVVLMFTTDLNGNTYPVYEATSAITDNNLTQGTAQIYLPAVKIN